jgi:cytochrome P450
LRDAVLIGLARLGTCVYRKRYQTVRVRTRKAVMSTETRLPPGPRLPAAVQGMAFATMQQRVMPAMQRRYGDAFTTAMPGMRRCVIVSDPELVKAVFKAKPDVLHGGVNPLSHVLGPSSMFSLDEARHLSQRRLLLPPFHGERMKSYEAIIEEEALREMATWPEGEEFATFAPMMRITLNAILRAVFGAEDEELDGLRKLLPAMTKLGSRLVMVPALQRDLGRLSPWQRFMRQRAAYDRLVEALIDKGRRDPALEERADVLALLLQATHEDGTPMTDAEITDQLLTLLVAGHETTAGTLAWSVERLRRHPAVLSRLVAEAADGGGAYREATIREVQRTRPVIVGTGRYVAKPFDLGPWRLPPGYMIIIAATTMHLDSRFFARPREFDPGRFLGRKPDTYQWVPFGGGLRRCIGAAFAHMEMDVVLRTMLREFELAPATERPERWRFRGVAFVPSRGGQAMIRRRGYV